MKGLMSKMEQPQFMESDGKVLPKKNQVENKKEHQRQGTEKNY